MFCSGGSLSPDPLRLMHVQIMKRAFWLLVIAVAVVAFVLWQRSGTKTMYVNGLSEYNTLPNREYILQRDCFIFKSKAEPSSYPLIGIPDKSLPGATSYLPAEVLPSSVGQQFSDIRILDTVSRGTRFRIVSVRQDHTRKGVRTTFEILLLPEAERKYPRVDAYWIMNDKRDTTGMAPDILPEIAVPRVRG